METMTTLGKVRRLRAGLAVSLLVVVALVAGITSLAAARAAPSLCAVRYPSDQRIAWVCRRLGRGETLERLFGDRWVEIARFNRVDRNHALPGVSLKVPIEDVRDFTPMPSDYPEASAEAKFVLVDLSEQFLGAYEWGRLVFSSPLAVGEQSHPTPAGEFTITAAHRHHPSSLYTITGTDIPYPMTWALRFLIRSGASFWLHGRDMPGYPASHGCIGLYDEHMQKEYYGEPADPVLDDARRLYEWAAGADADEAQPRPVAGPRLRIVGAAPQPER
jgi:lipoprotein-anchoring transpeptidase ErfK/SrfK